VNGRGTRQGGFTIVEAAIGLLLVVFITAALASTFLVGYTTISKEAKQISADNALSDASLMLLRDLSSSTITAYTGNLAPGNGRILRVSYGNPAVTVTYSIDAQGNLRRAVGGGSTSAAARSLQGLSLAVAGCQRTVTLTPSAIATAQTLQVTGRIGAAGCY
jgi:Tfp pilus assembly protein PilE